MSNQKARFVPCDQSIYHIEYHTRKPKRGCQQWRNKNCFHCTVKFSPVFPQYYSLFQYNINISFIDHPLREFNEILPLDSLASTRGPLWLSTALPLVMIYPLLLYKIEWFIDFPPLIKLIISHV